MSDSGQEPVIGIDLGTTNSRGGGGRRRACRASSRTAAASSSRRRWWRSRRTASGWSARSPSGRPSPTPENTVYAAKRLIGRRWSSREVEDARKVLPYQLVAGPSTTTSGCSWASSAWSRCPEISALRAGAS